LADAHPPGCSNASAGSCKRDPQAERRGGAAKRISGNTTKAPLDHRGVAASGVPLVAVRRVAPVVALPQSVPGAILRARLLCSEPELLAEARQREAAGLVPQALLHHGAAQGGVLD